MREMTPRQKELIRQFVASLAFARQHGKVDVLKCARVVRNGLVPTNIVLKSSSGRK